jgi:hypothetical protein
LVVGVFRSGTSLLYSVLNQHPQVALMYECDVWDFPGMLSRRRLNGEWLARQEFYNQALSRHRLILGGSLRGLECIQTPEDLYRCHSQNKGAALWGEKSPLYSVRLARLATRYPKGSFILIWRDPVEIYRSMKVAGRKSVFFRRPGTLYRLIYHQERMVREAAQLERAGARVHHVHYDRLVEHTAEVCQGICEYLRVDFEPRMTQLAHADFSAVYQAPQHEYLRRGVIERQAVGDVLVETGCAQKLLRFRRRWERLAGRRLNVAAMPSSAREPGRGELVLHLTLGRILHIGDGLKRLAFEYLPLPWLRTYRLFRDWLVARDGACGEFSLDTGLREHGVTVMAGMLLLGLVAWVDYATGPEVSCGPLYLLPCGALALVVGRSWATLAALTSALSITLLRDGVAHHFHTWVSPILAWNFTMRFILFELFALLLNRIRRELMVQAPPAKSTAEDG